MSIGSKARLVRKFGIRKARVIIRVHKDAAAYAGRR